MQAWSCQRARKFQQASTSGSPLTSMATYSTPPDQLRQLRLGLAVDGVPGCRRIAADIDGAISRVVRHVATCPTGPDDLLRYPREGNRMSIALPQRGDRHGNSNNGSVGLACFQYGESGDRAAPAGNAHAMVVACGAGALPQSLGATAAPVPKPIKTPRAADPVIPDAQGPWLVLIGDSGETSADDIEAFFADIWPDVVEPETAIQ
jgi:hypothetical protein